MRFEQWLYAVPLRLRSLFRRKQVEQELDEELQYHLERKTEEYAARGLSPKEARYAALRAMDGLAQRKEECRDARGLNAIENTFRDIRYSLRVLMKSRAFTLVATITLALAICANAVVFGILNALILRPLNLPQAERLYTIERASDHNAPESYPNYLDLRDRNRSFESLEADTAAQAALDTGENASSAWVLAVSGNYFDVLGIQPYLGRVFHSSDEHGPNSAPYIVLSYAYWHNRFQDDSAVVGRTVQLNKHPFTIVGIAPPEFHGTVLFFYPDFFVPIVNQAQVGTSVVRTDVTGSSLLTARGNRSVTITGHLKAGVTPSQAIADLNSIGAWLEKTYPKDAAKMDFVLARPGLFGDTGGRGVRAFVTGLMLLAGLILLAACANLGSLFAARAADRSREVALRLALGSSRNRILRQLFTEALLISLAGGAAGLWGGVVLLRELSAWQPFSRFPVHVAVNPDANVYAVALALALLSGMLFGIVPVRQVLKVDSYQIVKSGPAARVGARITARDLLVGVQIAICAVLVTSSLVAVRGLVRSLHSNLGFEPRNTLLLDTSLHMAGYSSDRAPAMQKRIIDAMESIPGVSAAAVIDRPQLDGSWKASSVFTQETTDLKPANAIASPVWYSVSPEYFRSAETALLSGRVFTWHDDKNSPRVAVVNREFARRIFGSVTAAIGRHYKMQDGTPVEVVGVVEQGKYKALTEDPQPAMFFPLSQSPSDETSLLVRTKRDHRQVAAAMRIAVRNLDSGLPCNIQTWNEALDIALFGPRMATLSLGVLGVLGAMLSMTGIFGIAAYSVSRRLKELGIRLALGAPRTEVLRAALGRAFKMLVLGSAAGLALGILTSRVLAHIVSQATPRDPLVLAGVVLTMLLVGLLASWIPAQRALSLDPLALLREE